MGTRLPSPKGAQPPIFGKCLCWPIGCMDQDATWYGGRPRSRPHCARWGPSSPSPQKGAQPPICGPCLLWPNGWMDQDATWYDGRPRSGQHCVRCKFGSTPGGHNPLNFVPCLLWSNGCPSQLLLSTCEIGFQLSANSSMTLMYTRHKGALPWQPILG